MCAGVSVQALVLVLSFLWGQVQDRDRPLLSIVPEQFHSISAPLAQTFAAGPTSTGTFMLLQQQGDPEGGSGFKLREIDSTGRVVATYSFPRETQGVPDFAVGPSGEVYWSFLSQRNGEAERTVGLITEQGEVKDRIVLDRQIGLRKLAIGKDGSILVAGWLQETAATQIEPGGRFALLWFGRDGSLKRELFSPNVKADVISGDLSQLLLDLAGNIYLISSAAEPSVTKLDPAGEVVAERTLPGMSGTRVIGALFDDSGRLFVDRAKGSLPGQRVEALRRITVLDAATLDTLWEANCQPDVGRLVRASGGQVFFLRTRPGSGTELVRASLR